MSTMPSDHTRRRLLGEILSQLLNVPIMAGILITFLWMHFTGNELNQVSGYLWAMLFMCLVPLCSLFFYIPGKTRDWEKIFHRQRWASFVLMITSYPIGGSSA